MKMKLILAGTHILALGVGALVAKVLLEKKYIRIVEDEIEKTHAFFQKRYKGDGYETPEAAAKTILGEKEAKEVVDKMINYGAQYARVKDIVQKATEGNSFEEEVSNRDRSRPYVIALHEFEYNDLNHEKTNLTYYAGDDILADSEEEIVNADYYVGNALEKFGHLSGDPNVVYVRNERLGLDFEVTLNPGMYHVEVMGEIP